MLSTLHPCTKEEEEEVEDEGLQMKADCNERPAGCRMRGSRCVECDHRPVNPMGLRRLVQRGGGSQGVEGDFGSEHKDRRGGVMVEGKGSEGKGMARGGW